MARKNLKPFNLKGLIERIALSRGKKEYCELSLRNFHKRQQALSSKFSGNSLKVTLIESSPVFACTSRKAGRRSSTIIPYMLSQKSRIFYGVKTIISTGTSKRAALTSKLMEHISSFSTPTPVGAGIRKENAKKAFENKTSAHFRWF